MSEKTSDKRTYSVDEMMDRLREGEREKRDEGELVTREDGTQVMRVKKRKRRSKQKKEEEAKRRKRMVLFRTLLLITIPLVIGLGVLYLLAKYHSPGFAENVAATVWKEVGARPKIIRLSPTGNKVTARSVQLNWPDGSRLDRLKVEDVSGDLGLVSFVTGRLRGEELKAEKGHLLTSSRTDRKVTAPDGEVKILPGFQRYSSDYFSFFFGSMNSPFRLEGTKARLVSTDYSKQLSLTGGNLAAGSWGMVPLKRGTLEFINDTLRVISLRFEEEGRHLVFSGDLGLQDSIHSLSIEVIEGSIANVAGFKQGDLFEADLEGTTGTLVFRPWQVETHEMTFSCSPEYLVVKGFSFLGVLEELYGDARFKNFEFELNDDFELIRGAQSSELRGLNLLELGVLAIKGDVKADREKLSGTIKVGLPDHKKLTIRSDRRKEFFQKGTLEDGFFWFEVELSGTPENPKDNFIQFLEGGPKESAEDLFEQLTQ